MKTPETKSDTKLMNAKAAAFLAAGLLVLQSSPLYAAEYLLTPVSPKAMSAQKLGTLLKSGGAAVEVSPLFGAGEAKAIKIGRASCRERV